MHQNVQQVAPKINTNTKGCCLGLFFPRGQLDCHEKVEDQSPNFVSVICKNLNI